MKTTISSVTKYVNLGKMMDFIRDDLDPAEAIEKRQRRIRKDSARLCAESIRAKE